MAVQLPTLGRSRVGIALTQYNQPPRRKIHRISIDKIIRWRVVASTTPIWLLFDRGPYVGLILAVITTFFLIAVGIPLIIAFTWRHNSDAHEQSEHALRFHDVVGLRVHNPHRHAERQGSGDPNSVADRGSFHRHDGFRPGAALRLAKYRLTKHRLYRRSILICLQPAKIDDSQSAEFRLDPSRHRRCIGTKGRSKRSIIENLKSSR